MVEPREFESAYIFHFDRKRKWDTFYEILHASHNRTKNTVFFEAIEAIKRH